MYTLSKICVFLFVVAFFWPTIDDEGEPVKSSVGSGSVNAAYPNGTRSGEIPLSLTSSGTSTHMWRDKLA